MVCWIRRSLPNLGARVRIPLLDLRLGCSTYDECNPSLWEADQFFAVHCESALTLVRKQAHCKCFPNEGWQGGLVTVMPKD